MGLRKRLDQINMKLLSMYVFFTVSALPASAHASELTEFLENVGKLIKYIALIVGWGLGFFFVVSGIMDLMRKSDDPRAGGKGAAKLAGGIALIGVSTLISWALSHFGIGGEASFTPPQQP
ncbi:MAG: hypothetical protein QXO76_00340 [Thermoproteota archaeon]